MSGLPEGRTVRPGQAAGPSRTLVLAALAVALVAGPGAARWDYGNRLGLREGGRVSY